MGDECRELIWQKTGGFCTYCGTVLGDDFHVEHVIPKSRGGTGWDNLMPACSRCNLRKGRKTPDEFRRHVTKDARDRIYSFRFDIMDCGVVQFLSDEDNIKIYDATKIIFETLSKAKITFYLDSIGERDG